MLWILLLFAESLFGFELAHFFTVDKLDPYALIGVGISFGIAISSLSFFICSMLIGINLLHVVVHTAALLALSLIIHTLLRKKSKIKFQNLKINISFAISSLIITLFVMYKMYFSTKNSLQSNVHEEFQEELTLINSFAFGVNSGISNIFKIRHPYCYKCVCRSRWLTALHSTMMIKGFASLKTAVVAPTFLFIFSFAFLHMKLANVFLNHAVLSILSTFLFVFVGGFGFIQLLWNENHVNFNADYVRVLINRKTEWAHPTLDYLLAIRPSQLSLGLFVSLLLVLVCTNTKQQKRTSMESIFLGIISGLLLPVQHQVFMCAVLFTVLYAFPNIKDLSLYAIACAATAGVPLLQFFPRPNNGTLFTREDLSAPLIPRGIFFAPIVYWLDALGVFPIITLIISQFVISKKLRRVHYCSLILFLLGNFFRFQEAPQQCIVYFFPAWILIASIVFMETIVKLTEIPKSEENKGIVIAWCGVAYFSCVASALLGLYKNRSSSYAINPTQIELAEWIKANTPAKAIFFAPQDKFTAVPVLTGRRIYIHNTDSLKKCNKRVDDKAVQLTQLIKNPEDTKIAPKINYAITIGKKSMPGWNETIKFRRYTVYTRNK